MSLTRNDTVLLGKIASVLGCLTLFGTWVERDYYDYYGYWFRNYDGLSVFWCGLDMGAAAYIPMVIAALFLYAFFRFEKDSSDKIFEHMLIICIAVFFLDWGFNICAYNTVDTAYYTELHRSGSAGGWAVLIGLAIAILGYMADNRIGSNTQDPVTPINTESEATLGQNMVSIGIVLPDTPLPLGVFTYFGVKIDGKELPRRYHQSDWIKISLNDGMHDLEIRQMAYSYRKSFSICAEEGKIFRILAMDNDFLLTDSADLEIGRTTEMTVS